MQRKLHSYKCLHLKKRERSNFNNLTFNLKILERKSKRKETLQIITVGIESLKEWRKSMKPKELAL